MNLLLSSAALAKLELLADTAVCNWLFAFWSREMSRVLALAISFSLAGCVQVDRDSASKFASESAKVFDTVNGALVSDKSLANDAAIQNAACRYVERAGDIQLAPPALWKTEPRTLKRIKLLSAMLKYATALYDATDPARFEALQKAADDFADRLATVSAEAAAAAAPGSGALASPVIKPASRIISAVFVDIVQIDYQSRLHEIAASMDGNVEMAVFLLVSDQDSDFIPENTIGKPESDFFSLDARTKNPLALRRDVAYLENSYNRWARERVCLLRAIRSDRRVSSDRLYAEFLEANSSAANKRAALDALKRTDDLAKALVAIREAHKALLTGSSDFGSTVSRIRFYADRLSALKDATKTQ